MSEIEVREPPREVRGKPGDVPRYDRHVSTLWEARLEGGHVKVKVRAANRDPSVQVDHSRGLCGELTFDPAEWLVLRKALLEVAGWYIDEWYVDERHHWRHVAGAGDGISDHEDQRMIEVKGWPTVEHFDSDAVLREIGLVDGP